MPYLFDQTFQAYRRLGDGTQVKLRLVTPADKELLRQGMEHLSPESRYRRFLHAKGALTPGELSYLTEIDGIDHFAIGALMEAPAGPGEGVGVARFVRDPGDPELAEPSIVVLDAYQRRGLGTILFGELLAAARERRVRRFRGTLLAANQPMLRLLRRIAPDIRCDPRGNLMEFEFWLPQFPNATDGVRSAPSASP